MHHFYSNYHNYHKIFMGPSIYFVSQNASNYQRFKLSTVDCTFIIMLRILNSMKEKMQDENYLILVCAIITVI